jgi:hypothetical protein
MMHSGPTNPLAHGDLHVRRANARQRDGRVSDAVDSYCRAATIYGASGMHDRARAALTIAWRLIVSAADEHPAQVASVASELSKLQYDNGYATDAEDVVRTVVDVLMRTGHLGLAMQFAEWTIHTAQQDVRLAGLSAYVLQRMGLGLARRAPTSDSRDTLVDRTSPTDAEDSRDTLVDDMCRW